MTALSVAQDASLHLGVERPTTVFGDTTRTAQELAEAMTEAAEMIFKAHDWNDLKGLATLTGDGSTIAFDEPTDYDRMMKGGKVFYTGINDWITDMSLDEYIYRTLRSETFYPPRWVKFPSGFYVYPAMATGEIAYFWYIVRRLAVADGGGAKNAIDDDTDTFALDERLLKLGTIWKYLAMKGRPYAEEMNDFEILKEQLINEDKGFRPIRVGTPRLPKMGAKIAYPKAITP